MMDFLHGNYTSIMIARHLLTNVRSSNHWRIDLHGCYDSLEVSETKVYVTEFAGDLIHNYDRI